MADIEKASAPSTALAKLAKEKVGVHEVKKGVFLEILEEQSYKKHRHYRASLPDVGGIEEGFEAGPVYTVYAEDSHIDIQAGLTLIDGRVVRETAVVPKLIERYEGVSKAELTGAPRIEDSRVVLPLASQRMGNFCRWWLDSVAKIYICGRSTVLRDHLRSTAWDVVAPKLPLSFQKQTLDLLSWRPLISTNESGRLLRGRSVNSSGLTFGGGQRIGGLVRELSRFLDLLVPPLESSAGDRSGELLYISRNESSMRRILNEEEILPGLRDLGFKIMSPGTLPLSAQIDAFRNARIILAAHGAGLTNILFCRPKTVLIEIFPEGGVHGSAFMRMASQLNFGYYYVVGAKVENAQSRKNPNNSDLVLDKSAFLSFVRQALDAESRSR